MIKPIVAPCPASLDLKTSIISIQCRICYENEKNESLMAPCLCKGTMGFVHRSCLERWLGESNTTSCELCHVEFKTERFPRYTSRQAVGHWLRSRGTSRGITGGVRSDIIACTVITPVAIIITYACLFSSDYYSQKRAVMEPAAGWTSISLLIMIGMMLLGYYLWVYSVIRMHSRMWFRWWQRDLVVRYLPTSTQNMCCVPSEVIPLHSSPTATSTAQNICSVSSDITLHNTPTDAQSTQNICLTPEVIVIHDTTVTPNTQNIFCVPPKVVPLQSTSTLIESTQNICSPEITTLQTTINPSGENLSEVISLCNRQIVTSSSQNIACIPHEVVSLHGTQISSQELLDAQSTKNAQNSMEAEVKINQQTKERSERKEVIVIAPEIQKQNESETKKSNVEII